MRSLRALRAEAGSLLVFLPGAAEIRRTEALLRERISDPDIDIVALHGALDAEMQDRAIAPAPPGPPQGRAGNLDRRNFAHDRRRARGDRLRARARAALRAGRRADPARDRAGVARLGRSAARPGRAHRARRLLPAVGRAADRRARAGPLGRKFSPPICPASCSTWRIGVSPIRHRSLSRSTAGAGARGSKGAAGGAGRHRARRAHHRRRTRLRRLPLPPRLARMVVDAAACGEAGACGRDRGGAHRARPRRQRRRSRPPPRWACAATVRAARGTRVPWRRRWARIAEGTVSRGEATRGDTGATDGKVAVGRRRLLALAYPERIAKSRGGGGRVPAGQWSWRQRRSGVGAGARAVPRGRRGRRHGRAGPHRPGGADHAGARSRRSFPIASRAARRSLSIGEREPACTPAAPARRDRACRSADAGGAERGDRAHAGARLSSARHRPVAMDESVAAMARPRRVPAPRRRRRMAGSVGCRAGRERGGLACAGACRQDRARELCVRMNSPQALHAPAAVELAAPARCRGAHPFRRAVGLVSCRSITRRRRARSLRSACRSCSGSTAIPRLPPDGCRWWSSCCRRRSGRCR